MAVEKPKLLDLITGTLRANRYSNFINSKIFIIAAILLNPFIKISFNKDLWQVLDIILTVLLIISIFD